MDFQVVRLEDVRGLLYRLFLEQIALLDVDSIDASVCPEGKKCQDQNAAESFDGDAAHGRENEGFWVIMSRK